MDETKKKLNRLKNKHAITLKKKMLVLLHVTNEKSEKVVKIPVAYNPAVIVIFPSKIASLLPKSKKDDPYRNPKNVA